MQRGKKRSLQSFLRLENVTLLELSVEEAKGSKLLGGQRVAMGDGQIC